MPISNLQDGSRGARAMNRAYQPVLISMLRDNFWGFAIKRASLVASATPPVYGPANSYPLPPDFLDMAPPDQKYGVAWGGFISGPPNVNDYQIEGQSIVSDQVSPIQIRYVSSAVTESMFDASFAEAFSSLLAVETCEELTQSNTKLAQIGKMFDEAMEIAKKRNAFESRPSMPPIDPWITQRF
jgi:hypothetical protein